ncbi:hypothetical protein [Ramlibacter sp. AN1133]|uniref:hypothetical protein n=1 Tax=Ramlibacter sp. AN1133 TaxID=3133429 RepID=UPI0030BF2088
MAKPDFDERVARINLGNKIPFDFDPSRIDRKLCFEKRLTLIGLWHVDPQDAVFSAIGILLTAINEKMKADAYKTQFSVSEIAAESKFPHPQLRRVVEELERIPSYSSIPRVFDRVKVRTDGEVDLNILSASTAEPFLACGGPEQFLEWLFLKMDAGQSGLASGARSEVSAQGAAAELPIRPGTAFVLMAMDPKKPELDDVYAAIRAICGEFNIDARRADKFEHDEQITDLILRELRTSEFLIADLTYERPNVYYEVGYAHALRKRPILFRREGTNLHFDLAVHNVREYRNLEHLRDLLHRRLAAIFDREPGLAEAKKPARKRKPGVADVLAEMQVRKKKAAKGRSQS